MNYIYFVDGCPDISATHSISMRRHKSRFVRGCPLTYPQVHSPNMYNSALWKQSGHWQHYSEDMFKLEIEKEQWGLKPMNCPGHCLLYGNRERSYRELPLRLAEFGVLHRNEASGALTGLTRVRRFVQDDSHIFCREDQIESEMKALFDFLEAVYPLFGFSFKMKLSTMPEDHLGDVATWQRAEASLQRALEEYKERTGTPWELNPGDGAFYGPKVSGCYRVGCMRVFERGLFADSLTFYVMGRLM